MCSDWIYLKQNEFSHRDLFFPLRVIPVEKGRKYENGRIASHENIPNYIKFFHKYNINFFTHIQVTKQK